MNYAKFTYRTVLLGAFLLPLSAVSEALDFSTDIRPILSDKCFTCHGPDETTRKADLALHLESSVRAKGAIKPGDPAGSPLIERINSSDPDEMMPPPDSNLKLSDADKIKLTQWVAEGAKYAQHWAFVPISNVNPPKLKSDWIQNPIDAFVLRRLEAEGITPSQKASRETLIRRLSFDLTGLPPTPDEVETFVADSSVNAYEKVVEELLSHATYGERMANTWLDAARYADTYGYQNDRNMITWPWRDWVIKAFNDNLPYDEFIRWQIAGDLLPDATQEMRLATMFNRLHRQTNEGGSIPEEFRIEYVADRTQTMGTAFLGLTLECARCHDHKFDPITQKNYYELTSFFDNIDESGMYSHFTDATPSPSMLLYNDQQRGKHGALKDLIADQETDLLAAAKFARVRFETWLKNPEREMPAPKPILHFDFESLEDNKTPNTADAEKPGELSLAPILCEGKVGQAMEFDGDNSVSQREAGNFERIDPFSIAMWLYTPEHVPHAVIAHKCKAELDAASRGWELLLEDGKPTFSLVHFWPGNALRVMCRDAIPLNAWTHVAVSYDGSSRARGVRIYVNGSEAPLEVVRDHLVKTIRYPDATPLTLAARFRDVGFKHGKIDEFQVFDRRLSELEALSLADQKDIEEVVAQFLTIEKMDALFEYYTLSLDEPYRKVLGRVYNARKDEFDLVESVTDVMVMSETAEPRQAFLLTRGAYDARAEPVEPATPESIFLFPEDLPRNRLGFAAWLVDERNPLTARVAVNRFWKMFFGRGLVESQEDFGSQGTPPSHPELLDYLAHWFVQNNWDVKALCRLITMSATYRQDSAPQLELQERDPFNHLLARGPRHRLSAEQIRDNALAASGLLVETIGGPSVKPYQPDGLWEESSSIAYDQGTGEALYRRSMYTFWKRTVPHPTMLTFDATNREVCVVRRETTQTPLQALALLNDPQFVEAARVLAEDVAMKRKPLDKDLQEIFVRLTSRMPDAEETKILEAAYLEQRAHFKSEKKSAKQYAEQGEKVPVEHLDPVDVAALTAVVQAVMNFDEFQVKQ